MTRSTDKKKKQTHFLTQDASKERKGMASETFHIYYSILQAHYKLCLITLGELGKKKNCYIKRKIQLNENVSALVCIRDVTASIFANRDGRYQQLQEMPD